MSRSAARREATPAWARYFASRTARDVSALGWPPAPRGPRRSSTRRSPPRRAGLPRPPGVGRGRARRAGLRRDDRAPRRLRGGWPSEVPFSTLTLEHEAHARDGTVKALFATADGRPLEAVLMRYRDGRRSLCLSSQSGCPLTCTFCATGAMRFGRNLTASEILDQALHFRRTEAVDHCVFMGMGEPMLNLDDVLGACERLPDLGITHRRTAISTVGWIPGHRAPGRRGPARPPRALAARRRRRPALRAHAGQRALPAGRRARGLPRPLRAPRAGTSSSST